MWKTKKYKNTHIFSFSDQLNQCFHVTSDHPTLDPSLILRSSEKANGEKVKRQMVGANILLVVLMRWQR